MLNAINKSAKNKIISPFPKRKFSQNIFYGTFDVNSDSFFKQSRKLPNLNSFQKTYKVNLNIEEESVHMALLKYIEKVNSGERGSKSSKIINIEETNETIKFDILNIYKLELRKGVLRELSKFLRPIKENNQVKIFVDGGCSGIVKTGSFGSSLYINDERKLCILGNIGPNSTNNTAEYTSINMILLILSQISDLKVGDLKIFADSQLLVRQMNKEYKIRSPHILILNTIANSLMKTLNVKESKIIHVLREYNYEADFLADTGKNQTTNSFKLYF